jgi:hypothetical protein
MKLIFLDIDGVLNSRGNPEIEPDKVLLLNDIVKETGAEIVITSTWRIGQTTQSLQQTLSSLGFIGIVNGKTSELWCRGEEIYDYLVQYDHHRDMRYVVIDDLWVSGHENNQVKTKTYSGLTKYHVDLAIMMLNIDE